MDITSKISLTMTDITPTHPQNIIKFHHELVKPFYLFWNQSKKFFFKHISSPVVNRLASFRASFYFRAFWSDNGQVKLFASTRKPLLWWVGEIMVSNFVFGFCTRRLSSYENSVLIALQEFLGQKRETKHNTCRLWKRSSTSTTCLCYWLTSAYDFVVRENVLLPSQHACKV